MVDGLRSDVLSVGELGDDTVAEVAERIADLLGRSLPGRVLELLSDVAAELSAELPEGRVEIRVVGDEVELAYVGDEPRAPTLASRPAGSAGGGGGRGRVGPHQLAPQRGPEEPGRGKRGAPRALGKRLHRADARTRFVR